jgi:hypothetical protein
MSEEFSIIPSHEKDYREITDEVELSRTKPLGKLFRKHLLSKGPLIHPNTRKIINIDDDFLSKVQDNFHSGVCDIVQVPLANAKNEHSEHPLDNIGEVIDLQVENDKLYAVIDVRDEAAAPKLGKTLLGASAFLNLDYFDTRDGKRKGPTLLHAAVTNRPYVVGLEDYQEIVAATADNTGSVVLLSAVDAGEEKSTEEKTMPKATLDELLAQLKEEFGIDVRALQSEASSTEAKDKELADATALTNTLTEEVTLSAARVSELESTITQLKDQLSDSGALQLSNGESFTTEDLLGAVALMTTNHMELSNQVAELREKDARAEVLTLSRQGFIEPANVDAMTELKLTNPDMFKRLLPSKPKVDMEDESGAIPEDIDNEKNQDDYITQLTNSHPEFFGGK